MSALERAIASAAEAHAGQLDKAGKPYILHPLRVMASVEKPQAKIAAVLHDVVEDSDWTLDELLAEGFSESVVQAVDALSRRDGEDYEDFVRRAGANPLARPVKIADLHDLSRIPNPTERDENRVERYEKALAILEPPPARPGSPQPLI